MTRKLVIQIHELPEPVKVEGNIVRGRERGRVDKDSEKKTRGYPITIPFRCASFPQSIPIAKMGQFFIQVMGEGKSKRSPSKAHV